MTGPTDRPTVDENHQIAFTWTEKCSTTFGFIIWKTSNTSKWYLFLVCMAHSRRTGYSAFSWYSWSTFDDNCNLSNLSIGHQPLACAHWTHQKWLLSSPGNFWSISILLLKVFAVERDRPEWQDGLMFRMTNEREEKENVIQTKQRLHNIGNKQSLFSIL